MNKRSLILAVVASLGLAYGVHATVIYSYVAVPTAPVTAPGNYTLQIYLQESTDGTFNIAGDGGLFSGAMAFVENGGGSGVTVTSATVNTAAEPNGFGGFLYSGAPTDSNTFNNATGNGTSQTAAGTAFLSGTVNNSAENPVGTAVTSGTNKYLLGTVGITVASGANASFNVESLQDAPTNDNIHNAGGSGNTLTFNGDDLDQTSTSPAYTGANTDPSTFSVDLAASPVPEPASMTVFGFGAMGLLIRRKGKA